MGRVEITRIIFKSYIIYADEVFGFFNASNILESQILYWLKVKSMRCYLGNDCIHPVEMREFLGSKKGFNFEKNDGIVPYSARWHCMEIDCCIYEKVCQLADEYQSIRTKRPPKSARR